MSEDTPRTSAAAAAATNHTPTVETVKNADQEDDLEEVRLEGWDSVTSSVS